MSELRDLVRQIEREGAAGDPAVIGTVRLLADWLEEHGDVRAAWVAGLKVVQMQTDTWAIQGAQPTVYGFFSVHEAQRELARRVMEAMTRECDCDNGSVDTGGFEPWGASIIERCPACQGDGWLLTEAVACGKCAGHGTDRYLHNAWMTCPDCGGKGWRHAERLHPATG